MTTWSEEVSNEGHVYAAIDRDLASSAVVGPFEDGPTVSSLDAAEELAMEDDLRWLDEVASSGRQAAWLELEEQEY